MTARLVLLAVGFVLAGSVTVDFHEMLFLTYADGRVERVPATNIDTCLAAFDALRYGRWVPLDGEPALVTATCTSQTLRANSPMADRAR